MLGDLLLTAVLCVTFTVARLSAYLNNYRFHKDSEFSAKTNSNLLGCRLSLYLLTHDKFIDYIYIYIYTQGYYKRNRHFQYCVETKLLMI